MIRSQCACIPLKKVVHSIVRLLFGVYSENHTGFHENQYLARYKGGHNVVIQTYRSSLFSLEMWFKGLFDMSSEHLDIMTSLESANVDFHEKSS